MKQILPLLLVLLVGAGGCLERTVYIDGSVAFTATVPNSTEAKEDRYEVGEIIPIPLVFDIKQPALGEIIKDVKLEIVKVDIESKGNGILCNQAGEKIGKGELLYTGKTQGECKIYLQPQCAGEYTVNLLINAKGNTQEEAQTLSHKITVNKPNLSPPKLTSLAYTNIPLDIDLSHLRKKTKNLKVTAFQVDKKGEPLVDKKGESIKLPHPVEEDSLYYIPRNKGSKELKTTFKIDDSYEHKYELPIEVNEGATVELSSTQYEYPAGIPSVDLHLKLNAPEMKGVDFSVEKITADKGTINFQKSEIKRNDIIEPGKAYLISFIPENVDENYESTVSATLACNGVKMITEKRTIKFQRGVTQSIECDTIHPYYDGIKVNFEIKTNPSGGKMDQVKLKCWRVEQPGKGTEYKLTWNKADGSASEDLTLGKPLNNRIIKSSDSLTLLLSGKNFSPLKVSKKLGVLVLEIQGQMENMDAEIDLDKHILPGNDLVQKINNFRRGPTVKKDLEGKIKSFNKDVKACIDTDFLGAQGCKALQKEAEEAIEQVKTAAIDDGLGTATCEVTDKGMAYLDIQLKTEGFTSEFAKNGYELIKWEVRQSNNLDYRLEKDKAAVVLPMKIDSIGVNLRLRLGGNFNPKVHAIENPQLVLHVQGPDACYLFEKNITSFLKPIPSILTDPNYLDSPNKEVIGSRSQKIKTLVNDLKQQLFESSTIAEIEEEALKRIKEAEKSVYSIADIEKDLDRIRELLQNNEIDNKEVYGSLKKAAEDLKKIQKTTQDFQQQQRCIKFLESIGKIDRILRRNSTSLNVQKELDKEIKQADGANFYRFVEDPYFSLDALLPPTDKSKFGAYLRYLIVGSELTLEQYENVARLITQADLKPNRRYPKELLCPEKGVMAGNTLLHDLAFNNVEKKNYVYTATRVQKSGFLNRLLGRKKNCWKKKIVFDAVRKNKVSLLAEALIKAGWDANFANQRGVSPLEWLISKECFNFHFKNMEAPVTERKRLYNENTCENLLALGVTLIEYGGVLPPEAEMEEEMKKFLLDQSNKTGVKNFKDFRKILVAYAKKSTPDLESLRHTKSKQAKLYGLMAAIDEGDLTYLETFNDKNTYLAGDIKLPKSDLIYDHKGTALSLISSDNNRVYVDTKGSISVYTTQKKGNTTFISTPYGRPHLSGTPLLIAFRYFNEKNSLPFIRSLLQDPSCDVHIKDETERTAMNYAQILSELYPNLMNVLKKRHARLGLREVARLQLQWSNDIHAIEEKKPTSPIFKP